MKLYGTQLSPFVRKVRIMLEEKKLGYEFILCNQWAPDSIVLKMNPLSKVPVLELDDGQFLFESPFIMEWLDEHHGKSMIPTQHEARWKVKHWHNLANAILDAVSVLNSEYRRPADKQWLPAIERSQERVDRTLDVAEADVGDDVFLVAPDFTIADIAFGVALTQIDIRYPHDWRSAHPRLARWHRDISLRPSFVATAAPPESLKRLGVG